MPLLKEFSSAVRWYAELGELIAESVVFKEGVGYFRKRLRGSGRCRGRIFTIQQVSEINKTGAGGGKLTLNEYYNFVLIVRIERVVCTRLPRDIRRGGDSWHPF